MWYCRAVRTIKDGWDEFVKDDRGVRDAGTIKDGRNVGDARAVKDGRNVGDVEILRGRRTQ